MAAKTRKISPLIESQLPGFISSDYENFTKFIEKYYEHLESPGQSLDIINNISKYRDINYYEKNLLNQQTALAESIEASDIIIEVEDATSFPEQNGYISIDNEICFYKSRTDTQFLEVSRGVSGNTKIGDLYEKSTFVTSNAAEHSQGAVVLNVSNLFLYALVKNFEAEYLAAFPEKYLDQDVDKRTLIKNIKKFYKSKGTDTSIKFVFNSVVPQNKNNVPVTYNPKDYTLKSSTSDWVTKHSLKVKVFGGNVEDLIGQQIVQTTPRYASAVVDNVIYIGKYAGEDLYELVLAPDSINSEFEITTKTQLAKTFTASQEVGERINVVSTFGWGTKGKLLIGEEQITFDNKNVNQFVIESRTGTRRTYQAGTDVYDYLPIKVGNVSFIVLGILYNLNVKTGAPYSNSGDKIEISNAGFDTKDPIIYDVLSNRYRWLLNESNTPPSIPLNPQVQSSVSNLIADVSAIYEDDQYYYICSAGFPSHQILKVGITQSLQDQKHLKLIRKYPTTVTEVYPTQQRDTGIFIDGTVAMSYKDEDFINFGKLTNIAVTNKGTGYKAAPFVLVNNEPGKADANLSGEVVESINIKTNQVYTSPPVITITSGRDAVVDAVVTQGRITSLVIVNPGEYYSSSPIIRITDNAGRGRFAEYKAIVSFEGKLINFEKISEGRFYSKGNVVVEVIPEGRNAVAEAKIVRWVKNRYEKLKNNLDDSNGYVFANIDLNKGYGYGRVANPVRLRAAIGDNLTNVFSESSTLSHSPILGFAYDGNPIYGPYGFENPTDSDSNIVKLQSGYVKKTSRLNGPSVSTYPLGTFIDDYEWIPSIQTGKTILDKNNGRFCVTPEYPQGTYAYFITLTSTNQPAFPYIVGENYYSLPVDSNYNSPISQDDLPNNVRRLKSENLTLNGDGVVASIESVTSGSLSSITVVDSPKSFNVGNNLVFNNNDTGGFGASAFVSSVTGENIVSINSKTTVAKIEIIENAYLFDGNYVEQEVSGAVGKIVGNVFNEKTIVLEQIVGQFDYQNKLFSKDQSDDVVKVINLILDQNSTYTKDAVISLTDGLNRPDSVIATGQILESTSNQNSVKVKVLSGEFVIDSKYLLRSSDLNNTPGSKIFSITSLSENLTPFLIDTNVALAKTDVAHGLAVGDKVEIDINPDDDETETTYFVRKRAYQNIKLLPLNFSSKILDSGIGRLDLLNSGNNYISGTYQNVDLVFLTESNTRDDIISAKATILVVQNKIKSITITNKGGNYKKGDILTVKDERLFTQGSTKPAIFSVDHVGLSSTETTIKLTNVDGLSVDDHLQIGSEIVTISSVTLSNNTITVIRGQEETQAKDHYNNQKVSIYNFTYRFNSNYFPLGTTVNDPSVLSYNSEDHELILKYNYSSTSPNQVLVSNVFYDNSTPRKLVSVSSVDNVTTRLEFSKFNENNFEINPTIDVQKFYSYKFDTSHFSMANTFLDFSPSLNENILVEEKLIGTVSPGNSGAYVKIKLGFGALLKSNNFSTKKDLRFSNYYYFIVATNVDTSNSFLRVISDPLSGEKTLSYVTENKFLYSINNEPQYQATGEIKYTTNSKFALGKINSVTIDNSGTSYSKVPVVVGAYVSSSKEAQIEPVYDSINKKIISVKVITGGNGYINPIVVVSNSASYGARFSTYFENGEIKRIDVLNGGSGFEYLPELKVIESSTKLYANSNDIGVPKNIKLINNGGGFYKDNSLLSTYRSSYSLIISNFGDYDFSQGEEIVQKRNINGILAETTKARVAKNGWRPGSNIIRLENIQGEFDKSLPIIGKSNNKTANIVAILFTEFEPDIRTYFDNLGYYSSDKGKVSSGTQKLTDSYFYQDYSYVIKSKTAIDVWRDLIKQTTHPAGFQLFGELAIESEGKTNTPVYQKSPEKITTINLSPKSIKYVGSKKNITQSIIKVENTNIERGIGSVSVNAFDDSETLSTVIILDAPFNGDYDSNTGQVVGQKTFTVIDAKKNLPIQIYNEQQLIITIDGVLQEPGVAYTVSNNQITFSTPPLGERIVEGQVVSSQQFFGKSIKFKDNSLNNRYLRKIRNIFQRNGIWLDSANQIRFNKGFIVEETSGYLKATYPEENWLRLEQEYKDIAENVITAVEHDLRFGGNVKTLSLVNFYQPEDEVKFLDTVNYVINLCIASIRNWDVTFINDGLNNQVTITSSSDIVEVPSTAGIAIGMYISSGSQFPPNTKVVEIISETEVRLNNQAFPNIGAIYNPLYVGQNVTYLVPSSQEQNFATIYVDGTLEVSLTGVISSRSIISSVSQITFYFSKINTGTFYDASNLIENNKKYIQEETIGKILDEFPDLAIPNNNKCIRDLGYYIDAVVYHLRYGGNKKIVEFGKVYYDNNRLNYINNELEETIRAYEYATELMILAMRNILPDGNYTQEAPYIDEEILEDLNLPTCEEVESSLNSYFDAINTILTKGKNLVVLSPENDQKSGNWTSIKTYSNYSLVNDTPLFNSECQEVVSSLLSLYGMVETILSDGAGSVELSLPDYFDGENDTFDLYYENGSIVKTDVNENLFVTLNSVLQKPYYQSNLGEIISENSYYILRSNNPNVTDKIVFSTPPKWDQDENALSLQEATAVEKFFAFSIGSYDSYTINNELIPYVGKGPYSIVSSKNGKIITIDNENYALVFVNGILQKQGESYNIFGSTIVFSQPLPYFISESGDKTYADVNIILMYGRDLAKSVTFYDFEPDTYYNRIELRISGIVLFEDFILKLYNFSGASYSQVFQKKNGKNTVVGKIRGYSQIGSNYWILILAGNNVDFDDNASIFIGPENDFDSDKIIEINSDLVIQSSQIFVIPEESVQYYGTITTRIGGELVVEGTVSSVPTEIYYSEDSDGNRIVRRDMPFWLYETDLGDKSWRKASRNCANLIEGDLIQIDGENDYREIIQLPEIVKSKQFNVNEQVSNNIYGNVKVTNYNDITRGEGLGVRSTISNGKVNNLIWNKRDLNLYFNNNILLQSSAYQYYTPPIIKFVPVDDNGGGARAEVIAVGGQIIDIVLLDGGSGYTAPPKVVVTRGYNKIKKIGRQLDSLSIINIAPQVVVNSFLNVSYELIIEAATPEIKIITSNVVVSPIDVSVEIFRLPILIRSIVEVPIEKIDKQIITVISPQITINSISETSRSSINIIETRSDVISINTIEKLHNEIISSLSTTITGAITKYPLPTVNDLGAFLDIGLSETDDIVYISNTLGFPSTGRLLIGKEVVFYSRKLSDRFLDVLRGQYGTIATTHNAGDYLRLIADTISVVPTPVVQIYSESTISVTHSTKSHVTTTIATRLDQIQKVDPKKDAVEIVVGANINVDNSDTLVSSVSVIKYHDSFETVIRSKFDLVYNKTEILTSQAIDVVSSIVSNSSNISIIDKGTTQSVSSTIATINDLLKEVVSIVSLGDYLITPEHYNYSEVKIDVNTIDFTSSTSVASSLDKPADIERYHVTGIIDYFEESVVLANLLSTRTGLVALNDPINEVILRGGSNIIVINRSIVKETYFGSYTVGNAGFTLKTFENNVFINVGSFGVNGTIESLSLAYPSLVIKDFEERQNSNITLNGEIFRLGIPTINSVGTTLAANVSESDTTIQVSSTTGFPTTGTLLIGKEIITYTNKTSTSFIGINRGVMNTVVTTHLSGDYLRTLD